MQTIEASETRCSRNSRNEWIDDGNGQCKDGSGRCSDGALDFAEFCIFGIYLTLMQFSAVPLNERSIVGLRNWREGKKDSRKGR